MCGRYTLTTQDGLVEDMEAVLDPDAPKNEWWKPRFNVAPTQDAPVVRLRDGVRSLEMMRWGLVPHWAAPDRNTGKAPPLMINARVETLQDKPAYRDALARRRCLVPADGFFEWKKDGAGKKATKQAMFIHPDDRGFFAFAGLYARAGDLRSFTIITGPPNPLVAPIHDRMPVILARDAWAAWLDPSLPADGARALLDVPPAAHWVAEPVSSWVNSADHDDPQCIAPAAAAGPRQTSLF
jgi:putative SOS response-associated peptidase YedK